MEKKINITVNGREYKVNAGKTILESCKEIGIDIPSLCYLKDVSHNASCGICVVEVKGARTLVRSCVTQAAEGMVVKTNSTVIDETRKTNLELLLANQPKDCLFVKGTATANFRILTAPSG